ncbi:MAG: hypothetical protein NTY96_03735 [Bacteroidetes bacterium]|nr:hypothetical protein [Bacteroidota bacterium]
MKKIVIFSVFAILLTRANAQFIPRPLNFPSDNYGTEYLSIVDSNNVWVGADLMIIGGSYSNAINTTDGGNTWQFYNIPETGTSILICGVCALDARNCYYLLYNGTNGSIWKTENGGSLWTRKTTIQFAGGFANFYHAFTADTGMAGGDPNGGYWEIQRTFDGGNTWARVLSANIPASLNQEAGTSPCGYSAAGNNIWFSTNKGRCYRSTNKGLNWTVKQVTSGGIQYSVCFVDSLRGVFWQPSPWSKNSTGSLNTFYSTTDGGLTWVQRSLDPKYYIRSFSRVPGINGGMVICAYDTNQGIRTTVLFTPDFLTTIVVVQSGLFSDGNSCFINNTTGWLSGAGLQDNDIFSFTGNLWEYVGLQEIAGKSPQLHISPNPSSAEAMLKVPESFSQKNMILKVLDVTGKLMEHRSISTTTKYIHLNAANYPDGLCIIQLTTDSGESAVCRWSILHKDN